MCIDCTKQTAGRFDKLSAKRRHTPGTLREGRTETYMKIKIRTNKTLRYRRVFGSDSGKFGQTQSKTRADVCMKGKSDQTMEWVSFAYKNQTNKNKQTLRYET